MSFLAKQPALPQTAAAEQQQQSTYREADPVGLGYGREVWGSHWISKDYNWRTAYGGQNKAEWQYCSIAAAYRTGPIDFVGKIFRDGKEIANLDYTFAPGEDSHEFVLNPALALGQAWKVIVYRGTESQLPSATLAAGTGQPQPAYRGLVWAEWINIDLGQGVTSIPSLSLELGRHAPTVGGYTGSDSHPYGVNPFAAIYGFATDPKGGLGGDGSIFDATHWGDQALALESIGIGQRLGNLVHCHPMLAQPQDAATFFASILSYVDGFLYAEGDQLKVGWFPHQSPDVGAIPEITEGDLDAKPSGNGFGDASAGPSDVVVIFKDWTRRYTESPASAPAPANLETGLLATPVRKERPWLHDAEQAAIVAAELAAEASGNGSDDGVTLNVLKSRAVGGSGAPLMPGDLFNWDYGPHSRDLVCRVVSRRMRSGQASDVLTVIRERGAYPRPYVAPVDPRVLPADDLPGEISTADVRLWFVPAALTSGTRRVAALINRTKRTIYRADLHLSPSGSPPWEVVLDSRFFAAKCAVGGSGIDGVATTVRVTSASVDFARMAAQSSVAQTDDTLLLLIGNEVVSVGAITVVSSGVYDLAILRARRGTGAAAHAAGEVCWLFYRVELQSYGAEHAEFFKVRDGSNVYDAGVATKHFKIALFTINADGLAKPDDPGLSLTLPDLTDDEALAAAGYTIVLTSEAHTVACDNAGNPNAGQLGAGSTAKTDVQVFRGDTALTPVTSGPGTTEFSISLGTHTSATATKEDNDTVRCDSLSADTGIVAIVVNIAGVITVTKRFTLTKAKAGAAGANGTNGTNGAAGPVGPGLVYVGAYNAANAYFHTSVRRDVVSYGGAYYVTNNTAKSGLATWGVPGGSDWTAPDATYKFVATSLLLAEDATIIKTLVMGDGATGNGGIIRSVGANAFNSGAGFWLNPRNAGNLTEWRVGDPAGKQLSWDGNELIFGVASGKHIRFYSSGSSVWFDLLDGSTLRGFWGFNAGNPTLDMGGDGVLQNAASIGGALVRAFSTADPRTSDAPLYSGGGAYIAKSLDVLGTIYNPGGWLRLNASGRQELASYSSRSISMSPQGAEAWTFGTDGNLKSWGGAIGKVTDDGWSVGLYSGGHIYAFKWDGTHFQVRVDATVFNLT